MTRHSTHSSSAHAARLADGDAAGSEGISRPLVDRATFPSDTLSTHILHPLGATALSRWGLLDRLTATGCPPIHTYAFDFGPFTHCRRAGHEEAPLGLLSAAHHLDKLLVDAAAESGAEVREGFAVEEVLIEDGRVVGIKGHSKHGDPSPSTPVSSSAPTADARSWPKRSGPSSMTRSRPCSPATTPTGADCRWTAVRDLRSRQARICRRSDP